MNAAKFLPPEVEEDDLLDFTAELEQAARIVDLDPWILQRLKHPEREITVNLPLVCDDGETVNLTGYRVQHSRAHGPSIGPLLISPEAHPAQLRALAASVTLQCALLDVPLGGAAGAVVADIDALSERELRHAVKDYVNALRHVLGPMEDVLSPEVNEQVAAWVLDSYAHAAGQGAPAAVVAKPAALGGLPDARAAIAHATVFLIEQALDANRLRLSGSRIAIQGFGTATAAMADRLQAAGALVIAVSDRSGGVMRSEGLDIERLRAHHNQGGIVFGLEGADAVSNAEVLESECEVLIAAAAARQLSIRNAQRIRARVVLESIAGAVTPGAERILSARAIEVIPAVIGTAATLRTRVLEWEFGLRYAVPEPGEAEAVIANRILRAYQETRERARLLHCAPRAASQVIALEKLSAVMRLR